MSNAPIQGITFTRPASAAGRVSATDEVMPVKGAGDDHDLARRFREIALPHLDEAYSLARHLLRNPADAEDAVQECYLRALRHFHSYRGPAIRPWLFAILRNVCHAEFLRRASAPLQPADDGANESDAAAPLWQEAQESPERRLLRRADASAIRDMIATLDEPFREVIVLREIHNLSYREIAAVIDVPVGTVMSRLARARATLRDAWIAEQERSR